LRLVAQPFLGFPLPSSAALERGRFRRRLERVEVGQERVAVSLSEGMVRICGPAGATHHDERGYVFLGIATAAALVIRLRT